MIPCGINFSITVSLGPVAEIPVSDALAAQVDELLLDAMEEVEVNEFMMRLRWAMAADLDGDE